MGKAQLPEPWLLAGWKSPVVGHVGWPPFLSSHSAGAYRNYGERLYVEGRLDAMRKEQMVSALRQGAAATRGASLIIQLQDVMAQG